MARARAFEDMAARDSPAKLSPEAFRDRLDVSRENMDRLTLYAACLERWRRRINLVGAASMADLWRRHMLDSAQLLHHLPASSGALIDLGSGAGFPGLVLAILTGRPVHLVEADSRKAAFLRECARLTGAPATVHACRIEQMTPIPAAVITARALAPLPRLLGLAWPFLAVSAAFAPICLFPKGAKWQQELTAAQNKWKMSVESLASMTESTGRILRLGDISRNDSAPMQER